MLHYVVINFIHGAQTRDTPHGRPVVMSGYDAPFELSVWHAAVRSFSREETLPRFSMAELHPKPDLHQSHPGELAHVQAQLHSLLDISSQMSKGIELAKTCVCCARTARTAFGSLAERADSGNDACNAPSAGQSVASALSATAHWGADQLLAGLEAQLLVNGVAAKAEEALAALKVSLQMLSGNGRSSQMVEVIDLHRQAAEVVSTCNGWLKLADAMAQLLNLECAHLEKLLIQHAQCEQLTAETLFNARQGSRVKS